MIAEIIAATLLTSNQMQNVEQHFPKNEIPIILEVAQEYKLTQDQTILLFCIRRVENSGMLRIQDGEHITDHANGMQFGVGHGKPSHPARRYAGNFEQSLRLQAQWAAGTIQKRYIGLNTFAKLWTYENHENWKLMVWYWFKKLTRSRYVQV